MINYKIQYRINYKIQYMIKYKIQYMIKYKIQYRINYNTIHDSKNIIIKKNVYKLKYKMCIIIKIENIKLILGLILLFKIIMIKNFKYHTFNIKLYKFILK
jgi:hypothetical protein